jgi:hypothetical protein
VISVSARQEDDDMCTTIAGKIAITGSGKGPNGWFRFTDLYVGYDHPFHAPHEHALSLSFVNESVGERVALELDRANSRALAEGILSTLASADQVEEQRPVHAGSAHHRTDP